MCTYHRIYNLLCIFLKQHGVHKKETLIFKTLNLTLSYIISKPTHITAKQLVLYNILLYIILLYSCNSIIWSTCLIEVVSTCSRQPTLITCWKKNSINTNDIVQFSCIFSTVKLNKIKNKINLGVHNEQFQKGQQYKALL